MRRSATCKGMVDLGEGAGPARHLWQLGHRLERPSLRPDVREGAGRPLQPRALSRRRAGDPGRRQRHARPHLGEPDQRQAADRRRPRQAARRRRRPSARPRCPSCRPSPSSSSPGFDLSLFVAAYAPAGTPADIVDRMQREIKAVISRARGRREADRPGPDAGRLDARGAGRRAGARDADLGRADPAIRRQGGVAMSRDRYPLRLFAASRRPTTPS